MKRTQNLFWGLLLIIVGLVLLGSKIFNYSLDIFRWDYMWPIFLLLPGLSFEFGYFTTRKNPGVLVPGGILTVLGALFFFENFTHNRYSDKTWPVYLLAVAFGLFQLYVFSKPKSNGLLIPIFILTLIPVVAYAGMFVSGLENIFNTGLIFGVIFIVLGIYFFYKSFKK